MKITFPSALMLLFIGLKLCHQIEWSWWWVLSPLLVPVGLWLFCQLVILFFLAAIRLVEGKEGYAQWRKQEKLRDNLKAFAKKYKTGV